MAIVIPARYASSRLPGKPLADIQGKPMIQHVYERALQVPGASIVVVATDDERIAEAVTAFGGHAVMTSPHHVSGTDRLAELVESIDADLYVNVQGDEPLVRPGDIETLVQGMWTDPSVQVGTLCHPLPAEDAADPHQVKLVLADNRDALYFSRAPIPYQREGVATPYLKHVGVYAYRRDVLRAYQTLPRPPMECAEQLEQLRLLAAGLRIRAFMVEPTAPGVDTHDALDHVRRLMGGASTARTGTPLSGVRLLITDVDGVLTDGALYFDADGECLKRFHVRDGLGVRLLVASGVQVAVVSGRDSAALRKRIADLGVTLFAFGVTDKAAACLELMEKSGVTTEQTACVGDDSIDLPAFAVCGLSFAVADAPLYVRQAASKTLNLGGGQGAFRELADAILLAQGKQQVFQTAAGFASVMPHMAQ